MTEQTLKDAGIMFLSNLDKNGIYLEKLLEDKDKYGLRELSEEEVLDFLKKEFNID